MLKLVPKKLLLLVSLGWFGCMSLAAGNKAIVLMDTTAPNGVYDLDNKMNGGSNAKELFKILARDGFLPPSSLHPEPIVAGWNREAQVASLRPDLVIIHRSSFFHTYNAELKFGSTNEFAQPSDDPRWRFLYNQIAEDKLISVLAQIGNDVPRTKFLVYSRGTDTNWLRDDFRTEWVKKVENRFPKLKGRITTMLISNGHQGSFRNPDTREMLRSNVVHILRLTDKDRDKKTD